MYTDINFKTKKQLVEAVKSGKMVTVYQPGGMFPGATNGRVCIEGPHYPEQHRWYCSVEIADSVITKVLR